MLNVAVQVAFPETLMLVIKPVPEQAPPQPHGAPVVQLVPNVDPAMGFAISCTLPVKGAVQVVPLAPQTIPGGDDVTVPDPVPPSVMVNIPPGENVAMQLSLEVVTLIVVVGLVPEQFPPQLVKLDPGSATAVS